MMDMSGQIIDQYRIESLLDSSPTGEIYRALDIDSQQAVAIKILHERYVVNRTVLHQMLDRFRAAVGLTHPHLVALYAAGEEDGRIFVASELEEDGSLRDLMELGPREAFPLYMGIDLIRQAAEGLEAAHRNGVIHGTIEPENLFLQRVTGATNAASEYQVKLGNFGLTLPEGHPEQRPGHIPVGTPAYLAPEQVQGGEPDERSDIYSLGVVLFEVATGFLPFNIRTANDAMVRHVYATPPSPRQSRPDIPETLSAIILRCLERDPRNRFATAGELATALAALIPASPRPPESMAGDRRDLPAGEGVHLFIDREQVQVVPGNPETLTITLDNRTSIPVRAMLTAGGVVPDWIRLPPGVVDLPPRSQVSGPVHILAGRTPESTAGDHLLVLRAHVPGRTEPVSEVRVRITVAPFTAVRVRLQPPVTSGRTRGTFQVALENLGNERRRIIPVASSPLAGMQFSFNPPQLMVEPGRRMYSRMTVTGPRRWFGTGRETHTFSVAAASSGSDGDDTTPPVAGSYVQQPLLPVWSLPVAVLAVVLIGALLMMLPGDDDADVAGASDTADVTATAESEAAGAGDATSPPETTPDPDNGAAGAPDEVDATPTPDGASQEPGANVEPTEEPAPPPVLVETEMIAFTSARDGSLNLYVISPDGTRLNLLISESGDDWSPAWSNDGTRIAWSSKVGGYDQIFMASSIGEEPTQLTMDPVNNRFPVWSPDDSRIIFNSGDGNETDLVMVDIESGELQWLTSNDAFDGNPCWAEGGERIIFVSNRTGSNEVFSMDPDGSNVDQMTNTDGNNFHPKCSPDGERIVFVSDRDGDRDIYVMESDGTNQVPLVLAPTDELAPVWSPDSSRIAFLRVDSGESGDLYVMEADGTNEELVAEDIHTADPNLTWSPDGTRISFLRMTATAPDIYVVNIETGEETQLTTTDAFDGNATWQVVQTWE